MRQKITKTRLKRIIDEYYETLRQKLDMDHYELVDVRVTQCMNKAGEVFARVEGWLAVDDTDWGQDYKVTKDIDL